MYAWIPFGKTIWFDLFYEIQSSLSAQPPPAQTDRLLWRKRLQQHIHCFSKNALTLAGEWVDGSLRACSLNITALVVATRAWVSYRWQCEASLSQTSNAAAAAAAYVICVLNLWQTSYFPVCTTLAGWGFRESITMELRITFHTPRQSRWKRGFAVLSLTVAFFPFQAQSQPPLGLSWQFCPQNNHTCVGDTFKTSVIWQKLPLDSIIRFQRERTATTARNRPSSVHLRIHLQRLNKMMALQLCDWALLGGTSRQPAPEFQVLYVYFCRIYCSVTQQL